MKEIKKGFIEKTPEEIVGFLVNPVDGINVLEKKGTIRFNFAGLNMRVKRKDVIGNVIQEWFQKILDKNKIFNVPNKDTQDFPDFFLKRSDDRLDFSKIEGLCEIKSYNAQRTPAFDIANYDSYIEKLNENVAILDVKYIIFAYEFNEGVLKMKSIFCKNIWEITGETKNESLKCQIKKGRVYNIRPVTFTGKSKSAMLPFKTLADFLIALYKFQIEQDDGRNIQGHKAWLEKVCENYTALHAGDSSVEDVVKRAIIKKIKYRTNQKCVFEEG